MLAVQGDGAAALDRAIRAFHIEGTKEAKEAVAGTLPQVVAKLEGHTDSVGTAAWSPDGQRIVAAGRAAEGGMGLTPDRTARVWNAAMGQSLAKLEGHTDYVVSATWSPDGQRIVTVHRSVAGEAARSQRSGL